MDLRGARKSSSLFGDAVKQLDALERKSTRYASYEAAKRKASAAAAQGPPGKKPKTVAEPEPLTREEKLYYNQLQTLMEDPSHVMTPRQTMDFARLQRKEAAREKWEDKEEKRKEQERRKKKD
jgi:hypothetical protein